MVGNNEYRGFLMKIIINHFFLNKEQLKISDIMKRMT